MFGQRLRKAREQAGWKSAQKFAESIGLEPHTYRKYERGEVSPNLEVLTRVCENLPITPNDLLPAAAKSKPLRMVGTVSCPILPIRRKF